MVRALSITVPGLADDSLDRAAYAVWPLLQSYTGIDRSNPMNALARKLTEPLQSKVGISFRAQSFFDQARTSRTFGVGRQSRLENDQDGLPSVDLGDDDGADTVAVSAYTLHDFGADDRRRRRYLRAMWDSGAEILIIIDRASPTGFDRILDAREFLLKLGRESKERSASAETYDMLDPVSGAVIPLPRSIAQAGSHILAPVSSRLPLQSTIADRHSVRTTRLARLLINPTSAISLSSVRSSRALAAW